MNKVATAPIPWYERLLLILGAKLLSGSRPLREGGPPVDFYLFWCPTCRAVRESYRQGFDDRLVCHKCGKVVY